MRISTTESRGAAYLDPSFTHCISSTSCYPLTSNALITWAPFSYLKFYTMQDSSCCYGLRVQCSSRHQEAAVRWQTHFFFMVQSLSWCLEWDDCKRKKVCCTQGVKLSILSRNVSCRPTQTEHGQPISSLSYQQSLIGAQLHLDERPADDSPHVEKWNIKARLNKYD